uniref:Uncharacterized protein n=1 Tax=Cannabis sativa TaxID=3483 RepID=A0A803NLK9_CANSA
MLFGPEGEGSIKIYLDALMGQSRYGKLKRHLEAFGYHPRWHPTDTGSHHVRVVKPPAQDGRDDVANDGENQLPRQMLRKVKKMTTPKTITKSMKKNTTSRILRNTVDQPQHKEVDTQGPRLGQPINLWGRVVWNNGPGTQVQRLNVRGWKKCPNNYVNQSIHVEDLDPEDIMLVADLRDRLNAR